ncbi:hypothetical protein ACS0TY_008656 [Phlomoides rotata]
MVISDENNLVRVKPENAQGGGVMGGIKFVAVMRAKSNRKPLSVINGVASKRGFTEKEEICNKDAAFGVHSQIKRGYAAQTAISRQPFEGEAKKLKTSENEDLPVPMSLEHSEIEMKEKDQMVCTLFSLFDFLESCEYFKLGTLQKEIEMEDIFEETGTDIDGGDATDPLAVVEYVEDLYAYYKKMENSSCVSPEYMSQQFDINERMRAILIDWLVEVHHKFDLRDETLFLTVNLIDRFLAKQSVVRNKLQLVGLVAMLLACKYEEVFVPAVDDLIFISDKAYKRKQVLEMETLILNTLQFNMSVPTPYVFMRRFLKAAQSDRKLELLSFFLIELCLVEYDMLKYPPSFLAAAAVYTAHCTLYGVSQWSTACEWHISYTKDQLLECSRMIVGFHQNAQTGKLTGVHRKYSASKLGYAARCEPAHFLVQ